VVDFFMNSLLLGPSHVVRMQQAIVEGVLSVFRYVTFHGKDGLPILDVNLKGFLSGNHNRYDRICIMVPGFRLGNNVLDAEPGLVGESFWFRSGYQPEYASLPPTQIVPKLLDQGRSSVQSPASKAC
jgi:hypothetical protein